MLRLGKYHLVIFSCDPNHTDALRDCLDRHQNKATTPSPVPSVAGESRYAITLKCRDPEYNDALNFVKDTVESAQVVSQQTLGYTNADQRTKTKSYLGWAGAVYGITLGSSLGGSGLLQLVQHAQSASIANQFWPLFIKTLVAALFTSIATVSALGKKRIIPS